MASALYTRVLNLVVSYVGPEKGPGIVERQIKRCSASPEAFAASDLNQILNFMVGAATLYVPDKGKAAEMKSKLEALAH